MIGATRLYLAAFFASVTALIHQPPHPWGASDGPDSAYCKPLELRMSQKQC